jgi:hypothetical protein
MWLASNGKEMTEAEWNADHVKCLGVRLFGDAIGEVDDDGLPIRGDTLLYLLNASTDEVLFTLPSFAVRPRWRRSWTPPTIAESERPTMAAIRIHLLPIRSSFSSCAERARTSRRD